MADFLAGCEGRGKPLTVRGNKRTGASGFAGTWNVRAQAGAGWSEPAMGGFGACLVLEVQALTDSGGKANGGVTGDGRAFTVWKGTEQEAIALSGKLGRTIQARALRNAARYLTEQARLAESGAPLAPA